MRSMLLERLRELGPVKEHAFHEGSDACINLIVKIQGQRINLTPILVATDYDGTPGSPIADDNVSALAALLELGRRWQRKPTSCPVWLVAFDLEE